MPGEPIVVQKQETTDIVPSVSQQPSETTKNLSDLFDKMEAGKADGKTAQQIVEETSVAKPEPEVAKEPAKEEKPEPNVEQKPEPAKADDPREVLRKAMEERAERKQKEEKKAEKGDTKETKETKPEEGDDVPEDELKVLPHDKPKTAQRIQAFLKKIKTVTEKEATTAKERDEKAQKVAELEKKLAEVQTVNPETQTQIKKLQDDLAMYRRRYELESDPSIKERFDSRVETAEQLIVDTLKRNGAGDAFLEIVKNEGGWSAFSASGRLVGIPDGNGGQKQVAAAELADMVLGGLRLGDRKAVEAAMVEQLTTKRERDHYFKEEQGKASEYFKKQEEERAKTAQEQQAKVKEVETAVNQWTQKVVTSDWLKNKELPENATPEQKAEVEAYNKYNDQIKSVIGKYLKAGDINAMLEVVQDAGMYWAERRTTNTLRAENERLKAELDSKVQEITKFKNAGRSVPKGGSIAAAPAASPAKPRQFTSLEDELAAMERGEHPRQILTNEPED